MARTMISQDGSQPTTGLTKQRSAGSAPPDVSGPCETPGHTDRRPPFGLLYTAAGGTQHTVAAKHPPTELFWAHPELPTREPQEEDAHRDKEQSGPSTAAQDSDVLNVAGIIRIMDNGDPISDLGTTLHIAGPLGDERPIPIVEIE